MSDVPGGQDVLSLLLSLQLPAIRLQTILDNIPVAVAHLDCREIVRYANARYCHVFNLTSTEICSMSLAQVVGAEVYPTIQAYIECALAGKTAKYIRWISQPGGEQVLCEVSLVPEWGERNEVLGIYSLLLDITEQHQVECALRDSEQRHLLAAHGAADGLWDWNPVSKELHVSPRLLAILGYPADFQIRHTDAWQALMHPADRREYNRLVACHLKRESPHFECEFRVRTADGEYCWVHSRGLATWNDSGLGIRMAGSISDISERKRTEQALRHTTQRLHLALQGSNLVLWDVDLVTGEVYLSKEWARLRGEMEQETLLDYAQVATLVHPDDIGNLREHFAAVLKGIDPELDIEYRISTTTGEWIWICSRGKVVERDERGWALRFTGTCADINERKQAEQRIQYLATRDALTELPNRVLLGDRLSQALVSAERDGHHLAVLFLDLDRFKHVNDFLGHRAGDELLQKVSRRISACLGNGDTLARQGGDEFIILLPEISSPTQVAGLAETLLATLSRPIRIDAHELVISASVGIAVYPEDGDEPGVLLRNADTAMYHAKAAGRSTYQFFEAQMEQAARRRLALENELRQALSDGAFCLYYQPLVDLRGSRIIGGESLIRWQHPQQGLICPDAFIPVAEDSGLIVAIGEWVLGQSCWAARRWQDLCQRPLRVAVNMSARQFSQPDLLDVVMRALQHADLPAHCLELEITESLLMTQDATTVRNLHALVEQGVELSVDDFGTGYASMTYLRDLPAQRVKIDRSFVQQLPYDRGDAAIVRAIVDLGHSLGKQVVAEGVETAAQLAFLRQVDCDLAQGYHFSRPVPGDIFEGLISRGSASW